MVFDLFEKIELLFFWDLRLRKILIQMFRKRTSLLNVVELMGSPENRKIDELLKY